MKKDGQSFIDILEDLIFGGDGDGDQEGQGDNSSSDPSNDSEDSAGSAGSASGDSSEEDSQGEHEDEATTGLRSALKKEREGRRTAERELKKFRKAQEDADLAQQDVATQATTRAEKAEAKVANLASGLLKSRLDAAIRKAATAQNFIDPEDAVEGVDRVSLAFEQDEDDPSDITVDAKSVVAAVKKLATEKAHWINKGTSDGGATGSTFGGGKNISKKTGDEALISRYPSLQHH